MAKSMPAGSAVGVDGCLGGWITVEWSPHGSPEAAAEFAGELKAERIEDLEPLIERLRAGEVAALAIDMPIGLLDHQPRTADVEARKLLGPRRSSVFPTPVRATLKAKDYDEACRVSREVSGKALSKQAFNLLAKIAELDRLVTPQDQDRLVEAHPECAFRRLAGAPLAHAKRTESGRAQRIELLASHDPGFAQLIADRADGENRLPLLDLIDAAVLAITARRVIEGTEIRLGTESDSTGLKARVVY